MALSWRTLDIHLLKIFLSFSCSFVLHSRRKWPQAFSSPIFPRRGTCFANKGFFLTKGTSTRLHPPHYKTAQRQSRRKWPQAFSSQSFFSDFLLGSYPVGENLSFICNYGAFTFTIFNWFCITFIFCTLIIFRIRTF